MSPLWYGTSVIKHEKCVIILKFIVVHTIERGPPTSLPHNVPQAVHNRHRKCMHGPKNHEIKAEYESKFENL